MVTTSKSYVTTSKGAQGMNFFMSRILLETLVVVVVVVVVVIIPFPTDSGANGNIPQLLLRRPV